MDTEASGFHGRDGDSMLPIPDMALGCLRKLGRLDLGDQRRRAICHPLTDAGWSTL